MLRSKLILPGLALALAGGAFAQGDDCSTATALTGTGATAFDTTANTTSAFGSGICSTTINQDAFWQWTAPAAGDFTFDTFGTSFDTKLSVWNGVGCAATCGDYNDDSGGTFQSEVSLAGLTAGDQVLIQVGGFGSSFGAGTLNITHYVPPTLTDGTDTCATPTAIGEGSFAFDTTTMVGNDDLTGCNSNLFGAGPYFNQDMFWVYTATAAGMLTVDTDGSGFDTQLAVHAGSDCAAVCVNNDDDSGAGLQSMLVVGGVNIGDQFVIQVGGYGTSSGSGVLNLSIGADPCASMVDDGLEDNDTCATAVPLAVGVHTGLVAFDVDADNYSVVIPAGDILTVMLTNNSGDIDFNVYDASCLLIGSIGDSWFYINTSGVAETVIVECVVGAASTQSCADYDLDVSTAPDPCQSSTDDSFEDNDDCSTAAAVGDGTFPGLFISAADFDHYSTCVADGDTIDVDILFLTAVGDLDLFLWDASDVNCGTGFGTTDLANGFSVTDNETVSWTNTTGASLDVIIEVRMWSGDCNDYDLLVNGSDCSGDVNAGVAFCDPATNNSTGAPAILAGTWGSGVGSDLHLEVTSGVPGQLAYFLVGNEATAGVAVSNGLFCLIGTSTAQFFRYNVGGTVMNSIGGFDATGTMINAAGTSTTGFGFDVPSTIPSGPMITITAGDTWHFQGWYRDTPAGAGTSNFTNGLSVTF